MAQWLTVKCKVEAYIQQSDAHRAIGKTIFAQRESDRKTISVISDIDGAGVLANGYILPSAKCIWMFHSWVDGLILGRNIWKRTAVTVFMCSHRGYFRCTVWILFWIGATYNAASGTDFARWKFKPRSSSSNLQALSCEQFSVGLTGITSMDPSGDFGIPFCILVNLLRFLHGCFVSAIQKTIRAPTF